MLSTDPNVTVTMTVGQRFRIDQAIFWTEIPPGADLEQKSSLNNRTRGHRIVPGRPRDPHGSQPDPMTA